MNRLHRAALLSTFPRRLLAVCFVLASLAVACDDGGSDPGEDMIEDVADTGDATDTAEPDTTDTAEPDTTDTVEPDGDMVDDTDMVDDVDMDDTADTAMCGNDAVEPGETCDGADLAGATCESEGFVGGTLACATDCTGYDTTGCIVEDCGDGQATGNESCDGDDLNGSSCGSLGQGTGTLACATDCTFDLTGCSGGDPVCGDGTVEGDEVCDGADLGGQDCTTQGYTGGTLACNSTCDGFDESSCSVCGDGTVGTGEACDGTELGGATCSSEGFAGGTLACAADCATLDTAGCNSCGDGVVDAGEDCDGAALGGATCTSEGFDTGTLTCASDCTFNTSACSTFGCGNGTLDPGEACEGLDVGGATCSGEGFDGGVVVCANNCTLDTSNCYACGDNSIEGPETCDGTALAGQSCQSRGFFGGTLQCNTTCDGYDDSACVPAPVCGNNTREIGEFCDGTDVSGVQCTNLGYLGGTLTCTTGCGSYDTSGCTPCLADPREDDDTSATATAVTPGATITDGTLCSGDADWFALPLNDGDSATLDLTFIDAEGDLELEVYRPDGTLAGASTTGTDNESVSVAAAPGQGGDWKVRVYGFGATAANDYTLDFQVTPYVLACPGDDFYEENDDQPRGTPLLADRAYNGILCGSDVDWFTIELNEGDQLSLDLLFDDAQGDLDLYVYRLGPTPVASSTTATDNEQVVNYLVPVGESGTYGVLVRRATVGGPFANSYSLQASVILGSVCGDGVIEGTEQCEGNDFQGQTCTDFGFVAGILSCNASCDIETTNCASTLQCPDDDPYENNDSLTTATPTSGGTVFNGIVCGTDFDFYSIPLMPGQTLTADLLFTHADGDLNLILFNAAGGFVLSSATSNATNDNEQIIYTVPATASSPYRLRVSSAGGASNVYTLQLTITP